MLITGNVTTHHSHPHDDTITLMQPVVRSQEFVTSSSGALNDSQALLNNSAFDIGDKNDKINFVEEDEMAGWVVAMAMKFQYNASLLV